MKVRPVAAALLAVVALSACGETQPGQVSDEGWRSIGNSVLKKCDGTTLLYAADKGTSSGHAIAIVLDAKECAS